MRRDREARGGCRLAVGDRSRYVRYSTVPRRRCSAYRRARCDDGVHATVVDVISRDEDGGARLTAHGCRASCYTTAVLLVSYSPHSHSFFILRDSTFVLDLPYSYSRHIPRPSGFLDFRVISSLINLSSCAHAGHSPQPSRMPGSLHYLGDTAAYHLPAHALKRSV